MLSTLSTQYSNGTKEMFDTTSPIIYIDEQDPKKQLMIIIAGILELCVSLYQPNQFILSNAISMLKEEPIISIHTKYIYKCFFDLGIVDLPNMYDIELAERLLTCNSEPKLLSEMIIENLDTSLENVNYRDNQCSLLSEYGYELFKYLISKLERVGMMDLYILIEVPYQRINAMIEFNGLAFDSERAISLVNDLDVKITTLNRDNSQITNILERRRDLYLLKYISFAKEGNGVIYPIYDQLGAKTGRVTTSSPNVQGIPKPIEGIDIRSCFVSSNSNYSIVSIDYKQIELVVLASLSNSENLIKGFMETNDFHSYIASKLIGKSLEAIDSNERNIAKQVIFSVIYGASCNTIAKKAEISAEHAQDFIDSFYTWFPEVELFRRKLVNYSRVHSKAYTIANRIRPITEFSAVDNKVDSKAERVAVNHPIQGSVADLVKFKTIQVYDLIRGYPNVKILMQIHDELILEMPDDQVKSIVPRIVEIMEDTTPSWFKKHINPKVVTAVSKSLSKENGRK